MEKWTVYTNSIAGERIYTVGTSSQILVTPRKLTHRHDAMSSTGMNQNKKAAMSERPENYSYSIRQISRKVNREKMWYVLSNIWKVRI